MTKETWNILLRIISCVAAVGMWIISVYFSSDGFNIQVPDMMWVGFFMAGFITVLELVFNKEGMNHNYTIIVAGIAAYAYGIWTNILGIIHAQGTEIGMDNVWKLVLPLALGIFLEITPEPLILWGLLGKSEEDLLTRLFKPTGGGGQQNQPKPQEHQQHPQGQSHPNPAFMPMAKGGGKPDHLMQMRGGHK